MDALKPDATFEYVTLKELLASTKLMCRQDHTTAEDIYIIPGIIYCAKAMMTKLDFNEKTATLPIAYLKAKLPLNFFKFDKPNPIVFTTNGKVDTSQYYSNFLVTYTGAGFFEFSPYDLSGIDAGVPLVNVQDGYLIFSNNLNATECTISYLGFNVNEDGEVNIPRVNSAPIIEGASALYKRNKEMPPSTWQHHWQLWVNGKFDRRGRANLLSSLDKERLSRIMNRMF